MTKYKRIYRAVFRMSQLRSEGPAIACRLHQRGPIGESREPPSLPSQAADSLEHFLSIERASTAGRARAADRGEHMRA